RTSWARPSGARAERDSVARRRPRQPLRVRPTPGYGRMMSHGDVACRALVLLALGLSGCAGDDPTPIRQGSGYRLVPRFSGRAAVPRPLVGAPVPQHPFMAAGGSNNMHGDSYGE